MCARKHSIKLFFMSDLAVFNALDFTLSLRVKEEGYFYSEMRANPSSRSLDAYQMSE